MLMRVGEFRRNADSAAHDALSDQLVAMLPPDARIIAHGWQPWASASFTGARHWFDIRPGVVTVAPGSGPEGRAANGAGDPAGSAARIIMTHDWTLHRCFVADAALAVDEGAPGEWRVEVLTVDD